MAKQPDVEWPTCEQAGCIGIRLASARVCLAHASEEDTAAALKLVGETGAIDARGVSITPALLERILAAAPRGENEGPLIKSCRFDWAIFTGVAEFSEATFTGDAVFGGVVFKGPAELAKVRFEQARQFGPLRAYRGLVLDDVQLRKRCSVPSSSAALSRSRPFKCEHVLDLVITTRCSVVRSGRPVPVGGQERGQGGQQLIGSLLGNPVAAAGNDQGLHVVGSELHRVPDAFTGAFRSADGQHGQGQPPDLALLVLRNAGGDGAVEPEAAAQVVGVGGEGVDVVPDRVAGQLVGPG